MYLSRLQLYGFKSFAQKTKLDFSEGITCVIGPNGSGKSNIVDAIRWVLGEQRVSTLRSDKMENVIFNGTKNRKPVGMAEISITIENNKNILNTEFDEVVISRRLYRSGDSQYLINKTPVRLKDVLNLFMDTGLGANSYSVIELKMIESILSENKSERRQLFEEAAGIVKYKIRRKSALRKLDATKTDLNRVNDIIIEVEKTVNSLSRQVGKARRYLSYTEELKKNEIDLACYRYHTLFDEIKPLQLQLKEISQIKEESYHQITLEEALLEEYKREMIKIEQGLQNIHDELRHKDNEIAALDQQEAISVTKSEEMIKTRERYKGDIENFREKIKLIEENILQYQEELNDFYQKKEVVEQEYKSINDERSAEIEQLQKEKNEIEQLNGKFRSALHELSTLKEDLKLKESHLQFKNEQKNNLTERSGSASSQIGEMNKEIQKLELQRSQTEAKKNTFVAKLEDLEKQRNKAFTEKEEAVKKQQNLFNEYEQIKSKKEFFEQIISKHEGYSSGIQYILSSSEQFPGVHGTLGDLISTDEKYNDAVETVLGEAVNFLVVDNLKTAENIINTLKREKKGRITMLPLDRINNIEAIAPFSVSGTAKALREIIKTSNAYQKIIDILLGDIFLVDNLAQALEYSQKNPQLRFITLAGETVNFNREISGGEKSKKEISLIGRKDQLKKFIEKLKSLKTESDKVTLQIDKLNSELAALNESYDALKADIEKLNSNLWELEKTENQKKYEINKHNSEQEQNRILLESIELEITRLQKEIESLQKNVDIKQTAIDELEKEVIQRTNEYEIKSETLQALMEDVQRISLNVTNLNNQITIRQRDIDRSKNNINELKNDIGKRENEIKQISDFLVELKENSQKRKEEKVVIWEQRDKKEDEKNSIEKGYQELKDKILVLEKEVKTYRRQHDSSIERSRTLELKINENKYKAESIKEFIFKEYSQDIESLIPYQGLNEQEVNEKIDLLKTRIKNLGAVNPLAVSEYDKEKERLDFLTKQRDDLLKAETSLLETIDKINKTARSQFTETFSAIKENFEKVFGSFFENGAGTLELDTSDDPLEADININVRTKGKQLQTLNLLSGGEKTLTAISLLFSIYLVKPSPFCILDEVDAPLDDVNILRFTDALKSFSNNTQFIVITHNKRTMEAASSLYGVTMEEEGISKLVSVKFN